MTKEKLDTHWRCFSSSTRRSNIKRQWWRADEDEKRRRSVKKFDKLKFVITKPYITADKCICSNFQDFY